MSVHELAKKIATELLTMHGPTIVECTRMQLMLVQNDGSERNMGGRNKTSITEVIERHIEEWKGGL